jgi:hypothetical protein
MTLNELRVAARKADWAVKVRNMHCIAELDRKVAEKEKEEKNVG